MESRFAHLRQRDTSVSMMRVKMSRRRSQSQKENRERTVNSRRQLDNLPELELSSMDASVTMANMSVIQEKTVNNTKPAKSEALSPPNRTLSTLPSSFCTRGPGDQLLSVMNATVICFPTDVAADERLKQLERWKERKALEKEKEKREKERKGVFKTGVYHPKDMVASSLPLAPAASSRVREGRKCWEINH